MDEELQKVLDDMDLSWEEKMSKQRVLAERKRRRQRDPGEDDAEEGAVTKRFKKTKYAVLEEDWGQEDGAGEPEDEVIDCDDMIYVPRPPPFLHNHSRRLKSRSITDYFP